VQIYSAVTAALLDKQSPPYVYISPYIGQGEHLDEPDEANPIPGGLIIEMIKWLVEQQSEFPTVQPSPLASGRGKTAPTSKAA